MAIVPLPCLLHKLRNRLLRAHLEPSLSVLILDRNRPNVGVLEHFCRGLRIQNERVKEAGNDTRNRHRGVLRVLLRKCVKNLFTLVNYAIRPHLERVLWRTGT